MEIASNRNQLAQSTQAARIVDLRVWMVRNGITYAELGRRLGGITGNAVQQMLGSERIPSVRHTALLGLGVPGHLLPVAQDVPRGKKKRELAAASA
jgi:hypothetical protein